MVGELSGQVLAGLVGLVSGGSSIDRGKKASGERYVTGSSKPDRDSGLGEERGNASGGVRIGFQLLAALTVLGDPFLEIAEIAASAIELLRHRAHRGGDVIGRLINIGGQRPSTGCDLPQLPGKKCLSDTRVTVNIKQETAPLIINRKSEIFLVLDHLSTAANKATLLPLPDAILQ